VFYRQSRRIEDGMNQLFTIANLTSLGRILQRIFNLRGAYHISFQIKDTGFCTGSSQINAYYIFLFLHATPSPFAFLLFIIQDPLASPGTSSRSIYTASTSFVT